MADDRPAESEIEKVGRLERELADLRSTVLVRVSRRPTGDIEPTLRSTAKGDTLLLHGQVVSRADHPVLWQWAQDQGLVVAGLFTAGDGSSTFGLPDFRGRTLVAAGTLGADSYALGALGGAATRALTTANLPAHDHDVAVAAHTTHDHNVAVAAHTTHSHSGSTVNSGVHSGHNQGAVTGINNPGGGLSIASSTQNSSGGHTHTVDINAAGPTSHTVTETATGPTSHTVTEASVGSATPVDVRSPFIAVNWLIWT